MVADMRTLVETTAINLCSRHTAVDKAFIISVGAMKQQSIAPNTIFIYIHNFQINDVLDYI